MESFITNHNCSHKQFTTTLKNKATSVLLTALMSPWHWWTRSAGRQAGNWRISLVSAPLGK